MTTQILVTHNPVTEDDANGYSMDLDASNERFNALAEALIRSSYPDAEVEVRNGQVYDTTVTVYHSVPPSQRDSRMGRYEDLVSEEVRHLMGNVYGDGEFWVEMEVAR